jgi:hypothetical protein
MFVAGSVNSDRDNSLLMIVIFQSCHQGRSDNVQKWQNVLGRNVDIFGWEGTTNWFESMGFNLSNSQNSFSSFSRSLMSFIKMLNSGRLYIQPSS